MKKITALLLTGILALSLTACAKTAGESATKTLTNSSGADKSVSVVKNTAATEAPSTVANEIPATAATEPATAKENKTETTKTAETKNTTDTTKVTPSPAENTATSKYISRDRAIEIALEKAGLGRSEVYELEAEFDKERNATLWEVDFETREYEYSYDINAETGKIVNSKITPENEGRKNTTTKTESTTEKTIEKATETPKAEPELITRDKAIEIALEKAGLGRSDVYELDAELDKERKTTVWEVDFETREFEYSFELNAENGAVIHSEKERND